MTDQEINRLVAERVMGWDVDWQDPKTGEWYGSPPNAHIEDDRMLVPAYCTDPAAWGGLLIEMARRGFNPRFVCNSPTGDYWQAYFYMDDRTFFAEDVGPGRALALAALRAYGVEGV